MSKLQRVREVLRSTASKIRRKPMAIVAVAAGGLVLGGFAYVAIEGAPDVGLVNAVQDTFAKPTVAELIERTKKDPKDAGAHLALGHSYFETNRRGPGLRSYERALVNDRQIVDDAMLENLVRSFGTAQQGDAASLITRMKLVEIERRLDDLSKDKRYKVRWGALQTLEKLGKASRSDFITAWMTDLSTVKDCKLRQQAVENLGKEGDKRALAAIREAKKEDQANTPWYAPSCLGGRADEAEKRILATR